MELKRVVITGLGAVTPLCNDVPSTWQNLINGVSGAAPITHFDASKFKTQFACELKGFDPTLYMDLKEARKLDGFTQYAIAAATQAMNDANFNLDKENPNRMGCVWGSGMGGLHSFQEAAFDYNSGDGTPRFNPFIIPKLITDIPAGHISIKYNLRGPNYATTSACASSSHSIASAFDQIRLGKADVIVTGGSESAVEIMGIGGFNAMHALSTNNSDPEHASKPFSKSRDGFIVGEGAACLILEELEHAIKRGAKIYAEIVGEGMTADAHHITAPDPEGDGAFRVMKLALEDANIQPEQIDYINAHGTSTPLGDIAEAKAIERLFGQHALELNISSTKSMTGHLLGATGALEAIATILAIRDNIVPPTINHKDDDIDPQLNPKMTFTFNHAQKRQVNYAISNTFGFGGHNASLVFKKFNN